MFGNATRKRLINPGYGAGEEAPSSHIDILYRLMHDAAMRIYQHIGEEGKEEHSYLKRVTNSSYDRPATLRESRKYVRGK